MSHYVYLVECRDGTLYTGYTTDVERRLKAHNQGQGAKYTRGRRPVSLLVHFGYSTKGEALRAERSIKRLSRLQKLTLVQTAQDLSPPGPTSLC